MNAARFEYIALSLGAVILFVQADSKPPVFLLVLVLSIGAVLYEIGTHSLKRKIARWPADLENARTILQSIANSDEVAGILSIEFGHVHNDLIDRLEFIEDPGWERRRFSDPSLAASYAYLREQVVELLHIVRTNMSIAEDGRPGVMLPLEWRRAGHNSSLEKHYRSVQKQLQLSGRKVVTAIDAFANCLQGASSRL